MKRSLRTLPSLIALSTLAGLPSATLAQTEKIDNDIVKKIKEEGMDRSQVMDTISFMTDVYGPRLTGAPETKVAGEWAKARLEQYGLDNAHLEPWGPFGRGWSLQSYSASVVEPNFFSLIAYPKAWTPSTPTTVVGEPIYLDASTPEELEKYRGKLGRAIVLISPPREVKAWFDAPGARQSDEALLSMANADGSSPRRRTTAGPGSGRAPTPPAAEPAVPGTPAAPAAPAASGAPAAVPEAKPAEAAPPPVSPARNAMNAQRLMTDKWQMAYDEGAAVVLEAGRGDGGTVFVASATMPRRADADREIRSPGEGGPMSRGARPWTVNSPAILPQMVVAAEHYNRLVRMIEKGTTPKMKIDIESTYHDGDENSFNVLAEIPGSDLKDELVMLGAHFDSWHSGTGATDNAIGCGVMMEAMRILKSIDATPRRTIRVALWTGEEQGLLGSRAYVAEHFGQLKAASRSSEAGAEQGGRRESVIEIKPEYEKFSAYFNLDNGAGKIRGIYLQGNEATRGIFRAWLNPFSDMGASTITASNTGGTDHQSFTGVGLPGFQFIQDPIEYDTRTHHSSMDVFERVIEDDAKQAAIIIATFAYHAAMRDEPLPRKPLEGNPTLEKVEASTVQAVPVIPSNPSGS